MKNGPSDNPQPKPAAARPKRKKRRNNNKSETLSRDVEITSFRATVRLSAIHHRGDDPYIESQPWLELTGTATEPVRDVRDVKISMLPKDTPQIGTARPASVGAIIEVRPTLHAVLTWPQVDFDRVWALAMNGHLKYAHLYFTKPHYNNGLVMNASFSNELEE